MGSDRLMAQVKRECARCGKVRGEKWMQELVQERLSSYSRTYVPSGIYVCSAVTSCKNRRKVQMKAGS